MINFISDEEKEGFWELSNTIRAENYEQALDLSKTLLEKFPNNKAIYHNQIGAMTYLSKSDYWIATNHYSKALEYGFDADACEDNIWESAVDSYKSLIDSEAGFCKIMIMDTQEFIWANDLVEKYENNFPNGKYVAGAATPEERVLQVDQSIQVLAQGGFKYKHVIKSGDNYTTLRTSF